ncbi:MAG: caspase family protein [Fimbriimonadaceae bacterium]|nr:caspase family protein [Chitinophagales bacterium]
MHRFIFLFFIAVSVVSCKKDFIPDGDAIDENAFMNPENLKVLIVGGLEWEDPYLESFSKHHRKDAELEQTFLNLGVATENIISLYDEENTLESMYAAFDSIAVMSDAETHFIFYFSGHGFPGYNYINDHESIYFANYDINSWYPESTGFNIDYIGDEFINKFKGNAVLFMADCCMSGGLIEQAQKFSNKGIKAAAVTSSAASNWSTGNWTFTQKVIDALNGDRYINLNGDREITYAEMISEINFSMRNNERQKYGASFFNWSTEEVIVKTNNKKNTLDTENFYNGQYVFAKHKKNYYPVQITGEKNEMLQCRFYNYADYENWTVDTDSIKIPYYVEYNIGDIVNIESFKEKTATIEATEDGFYKVVEVGGTGTLWLTYERLSNGTEQPVTILNENGNWVPGKILATDADAYFITYDDRNFQWDEWVNADRVEF